MNIELERYAKNSLKTGLSRCSESQQHLFKRMYAKGNMELDINQVVDNMDTGKLDSAMGQVQRTLNRLEVTLDQ